jgi:hypothetical protein
MVSMLPQAPSSAFVTSAVSLISSTCKLEISFEAINPSFATVSAFCCYALSLSNSTVVKIVATDAAITADTSAITMVTGSNRFARSR